MATDTTMTVRALMDRLRDLNPDALVFTEGCDCTGRVNDILVYEESVMLMREQQRRD